MLVRFEIPELLAQKSQAYSRLEARAEYAKALAGPRKDEGAAAAEAREAAGRARPRSRRLASRGAADGGRAATRLPPIVLAQQEHERFLALAKTRPRRSMNTETAKANLDRSRGQHLSNAAKHTMMVKGERQEDKDIADADAKRAEAEWRLMDEGTREEDKRSAQYRMAELEAKLAELAAQVKESEVAAPETCTIEVLAVRKGDLVAPMQPVVRVLRADDLWVKVFVPETELGKVRLGQTVKVKVDSYPRERFDGTVVHIASISEFTPQRSEHRSTHHQVFGVRFAWTTFAGVFKAGMAAEVMRPASPRASPADRAR